MSPIVNARNKRKSTTSPKASGGGVEIKKTKLTPEANKKARTPSNAINRITSTQIEEELPSLHETTAGSDTEASATPFSTPTQESQADIFSQSGSPQLTFLTPSQPPTFDEHITPNESNIGATMSSGYDSSASANGGEEFPVVRPDDPLPNQPPLLRTQLEGFAVILDDRLKHVASKIDIDQVLKRVNENSSHITTLRNDVMKLRDDLEDEERIRNVVAKFWDERGATSPVANIYPTGASGLAQDQARRAKYDISRRALRIWPIAGSTDQEIQTNLEDFLQNGLLFTTHEVRNAGIEKILRIKLPSSSNIHDEVKVIFVDPHARDNVSSKGKLLATYMDSDNKPQAGFRMDIPEYLAADHKLLNDYGFRMKRAHGRETRKFIKYDEPSYSLICLLYTSPSPRDRQKSRMPSSA